MVLFLILTVFVDLLCRNVVPKARFSPEFLRKNGSCPLTPEEVGLLLSGLGFKNSTSIYLAGKV